jgi:hypothetical protein
VVESAVMDEPGNRETPMETVSQWRGNTKSKKNEETREFSDSLIPSKLDFLRKQGLDCTFQFSVRR